MEEFCTTIWPELRFGRRGFTGTFGIEGSKGRQHIEGQHAPDPHPGRAA